MRASLDGRWYFLLALFVGAAFASASCSSDGGKAVSSSGAAGEADAGDDAGGAAGAAVGVGAAGHGGNAAGGASGGEAGAGVAGDTSAAGESGAAGAGAGNELVPLPEADFAATFAKLYCASVAHCCAAGVATCVAKETTQFASVHDQAIAAKSVYDPLKAAQCAKAIESLGEGAKCSSSFMSTEVTLLPCRGVFDGTVAPGGVCNSPTDCDQGIGDETVLGGYTGCAPLPLNGGGPKRCRSFVPTATPGDACFSLSKAGPFGGTEGVVHLCTSAFSCTSDKCVALPTEGQACPGGSCDDAQCNGGMCVAYRQLGETCDPAVCKLDLVCEANHCATPATPSLPWILDVGSYGTSYVCPG